MKNPLTNSLWKNELTKSPSGICQGILHSISSILTYYGPQTDIPTISYTRLKLKIFFRKKAFRQYEWRDPPRGQRHVDSNSPTPLASPPGAATCPTRQLHWRVPFRNRLPWKKFQNSPFLGISF